MSDEPRNFPEDLMNQNPDGTSSAKPSDPYGQHPSPYGAPTPQAGDAASNPYGSTPPPAAGQPQYGQPQYSQPQYGAPQYGQSQYGQPQYGGGYVPTPTAPAHPSATTALVLSLIGLVGIAVCGGITLVLSPFGWIIGARAVREIDANPGAYSGRDQANAGKIMGIIGTVLLVLAVIAVVAVFALVATARVSSSGGTDF